MKTLIVQLPAGGGELRIEARDEKFLIVPIPVWDRPLYHCSRHAYVRREGNRAILDASVARARLCGSPTVIGRIFEACEPLEVLASAGLAVVGAEDLRWEFHDLLFHQQSSRTDPLRRYGGTFRFEAALPPPGIPTLGLEGDPIPLHPHDGMASQRLGDPFAAVVERRCSARQLGNLPLAENELGPFLSLATRRLPSAGGIAELSLYVVVGRCGSLASGVYWYNSTGHELRKLRAGGRPHAEDILRHATPFWATGKTEPDVLLLIAAQVPRQAWKYEGIAYRNALLDTGVALESMYLAASALRLGGCALGWNEPALLASLTGISYLQESCMAAFVLVGRTVAGEISHP